jgi:hypothetical protein
MYDKKRRQAEKQKGKLKGRYALTFMPLNN